jgi:hypothetical protein
MTQLPEPILVPWTMKPLSSAKTSLERLADGRLHVSIEHDVIHGVTPEMLLWWFQNIEGDVEVEGVRYPRYRVWHPRDHVAFSYAARPTGVAAAGAVFHIHEVLGRDPRHHIDVLTDVTRLDEGGFAHRPRRFGMHPVAMDYTFERVRGGTLYRNSLTVGFRLPRALRWINHAVVAGAFDEAHGRAWLLHNVEEVGNFEFFLPELFATESVRAITARASRPRP